MPSKYKWRKPTIDEEFYYVYFLQCEGYVKIGKSEPQNLKRRLRCIATCCPFQMTFLGVIKSPAYDDYRNELRIHIKFAKFAHHGEWFRLTDEIRDFLAEHRCDFEYTLPAPKLSAVVDSFRQSPRGSKTFYARLFGNEGAGL